MTEISKTGVWVDTKTGEVVESEPEEGQQLIPKGSEITPDMAKAVESARALASGAKSEVPEAVTTSQVKKSSKEE